MTKETTDIEAKALALFERALDKPSGDRAAWIKAQGAGNEALIEKALTYLSSDAASGHALRTGGAVDHTLGLLNLPEQIGAYRIASLIGSGGMGAVYRAERASGDFDHDVAIKVIRRGSLSQELKNRFAIERQILADLKHPNIARLYDGGELETGEPYMVMEFIEGLPITQWADSNGLSRTRRLRLFQAACSAVAHAHQNLIIHRDITPSNVLVDANGEVKLIDFGVSKPLDTTFISAYPDSASSGLSFTPGFAAPERMRGVSATTLSDVFSLGKLLYVLMPDPQQDQEIKAIINMATAEQPQDRYDSVSTLISDIESYLGGFAVEANGASGAYKFQKIHLAPQDRHLSQCRFSHRAHLGACTHHTPISACRSCKSGGRQTFH